MRIIAAVCIAASLAGCASSPETITASYVSPMTYRGWTCAELAAEGYRLVSALQTAAEKQNQAVVGDVAGMVMIGLPLSSMTGNNVAPEVARLKGEHEALYRTATDKGCQTQPRSAPPT